MKHDDQDTLFTLGNTPQVPLAQKRRPQSLDALVGQEHFLNDRFRKLLASDQWTGFIFWGPPGTGKTSLASVVALQTHRPFETLSAVTAGVKEIREVLERSRQEVRSGKLARILFIDEVHRLNKAQQDVLLPFLEDGSIRFIGATTENPSFEINNAIASRCMIFHFKPLTPEQILRLLRRTVDQQNKDLPRPEAVVLERIADASLGDARRALNLLENLILSATTRETITLEDFEALSHSQALYYDKKSEAHYDTISAFIKSVRGSDPDAAVYYLARMLEAGEDPLFVARRLIILASEDIGNANPVALMVATSCFTAVHAIGMPEARIVLAQATTYLCCCDKSNRAYRAIEEALEAVKRTGAAEIPYAIRNAPTAAMKEWGYGKGYKYPHDDDRGWVPVQYLPDVLKDTRFYRPSEHGGEKKMADFLKARGKSPDPQP